MAVSDVSAWETGSAERRAPPVEKARVRLWRDRRTSDDAKSRERKRGRIREERDKVGEGWAHEEWTHKSGSRSGRASAIRGTRGRESEVGRGATQLGGVGWSKLSWSGSAGEEGIRWLSGSSKQGKAIKTQVLATSPPFPSPPSSPTPLPPPSSCTPAHARECTAVAFGAGIGAE